MIYKDNVPPFADNRIDYLINLINPSSKDTVLNIGISNIPEIEMKIEDRIKECWTVDLDKEKLQKAKKFLKKSRLVCEDITKEASFKENYFDTIVIVEVLEHLDNDIDMIKKIHKLLKPGGKIIAAVPNLNPLHVLNPVLYTEHKRHYSKKSLIDKIKNNGFEILHFNIVENWTLLANLYIHLFHKYILKNPRNFLTFNKKANKTYKQINSNGLDMVIMAVKSI